MRTAYRVSYLVFLMSGHTASWLATAFRALSRASRRWGSLVLPLQLSVLIAWGPARAVSLLTFSICDALGSRLS